ncbi:uncharacterized protein LOC133225566 isoform X3 [Neopsephotus bourkii]|uniref:uncharacterized protein LOC133225566 isoform X3 n=1 Tax=Neopsephotus bourkii TaxID=309878 RepID=UPI002AA5DDF9|nr:uncharacterized protein LOC133225566 isoform X3 [Neopsephotus bourkii]
MCFAEAGTGRDGEQEPGRLLPERYPTLPGALQTRRTESRLCNDSPTLKMLSRLQRSYNSIFIPARTRLPRLRVRSSPRFARGSWRLERAGRLLECALVRARGCGDRPPLWPSTLYVVQRHCPGYQPPQVGAGSRPGRQGRRAAGSAGDDKGSSAAAVR